MASKSNGKPTHFQPLQPFNEESARDQLDGLRKEPIVLLEEENPYGSLVASVEDDGRTVYLYLSPTLDPSYQPRAVWVRNLGKAPEQTDTQAMRAGVAPRMKKDICKHPGGLMPLKPEQLRLIWFMEGNGVALEVDGELTAMIPPWSGQEAIFGYSSETFGKDVGTVPFPLEKKGLLERLEEGKRFFESLQNNSFWETHRDLLLSHYENTYGKHINYFAVNNEYLPIIGVALFQKEDRFVYTTIGMSLQNMPLVELSFKEPEGYMRTELIAIREREEDWMPGILANMAIHPWRSNSFFSSGHSFESGYANYEKSDFILDDSFRSRTSLQPDKLILEDRYPVRFLEAIGLNETEKEQLKKIGNEAFLNQLRKDS